MERAVAEPICILVVEDDLDMRETMQMALEEEGYQVTTAPSLQHALDLIETQTFHLILSDLFAKTPERPLDTAAPLVERAYPTGVGVVSGWRVSEEEIARSGVCFCLSKPFDLDSLLTTIAAALALPLLAEQQALVPIVSRYFDLLTARAWDQFADLCTDDVVYILPGTGPFAREVIGKAALRAFTEETFGQFPNARFDQVRVYSTPNGLAARYHGAWTMPDGRAEEQGGAVVFAFEGTRISRIGVRLNHERLAQLTSIRPS